MKYSEKTLKYYENLNNIGGFDEKLENVGTGIVGSPLCGDVMKLQLFFDENDIIKDAKYKVFGCVSAIASMELATTLLKGKSIEDALKIRNEDVADSLELTDLKKHCSVLAKEAIESAINDYKNKKNGEICMLNVTEKASEKLKELVKEHKCKGISVSVVSGGCSGVDYSLSYEMELPNDKMSFEAGGVVFFYDKNMEIMIKGAAIDLVENSFGLGFIITNKNHINCQNCSCGC